jgi:hypothetical protein
MIQSRDQRARFRALSLRVHLRTLPYKTQALGRNEWLHGQQISCRLGLDIYLYLCVDEVHQCIEANIRGENWRTFLPYNWTDA